MCQKPPHNSCSEWIFSLQAVPWGHLRFFKNFAIYEVLAFHPARLQLCFRVWRRQFWEVLVKTQQDRSPLLICLYSSHQKQNQEFPGFSPHFRAGGGGGSVWYLIPDFPQWLTHFKKVPQWDTRAVVIQSISRHDTDSETPSCQQLALTNPPIQPAGTWFCTQGHMQKLLAQEQKKRCC